MRTTNKLKLVIIVILLYIATVMTVKAQPPNHPPHGWGNHPWGNPPGIEGCFEGPCIPIDNYIELAAVAAGIFGAGVLAYRGYRKS
jgi:hypothetical protein